VFVAQKRLFFEGRQSVGYDLLRLQVSDDFAHPATLLNEYAHYVGILKNTTSTQCVPLVINELSHCAILDYLTFKSATMIQWTNAILGKFYAPQRSVFIVMTNRP
jgi:hypothetical protein